MLQNTEQIFKIAQLQKEDQEQRRIALSKSHSSLQAFRLIRGQKSSWSERGH
jgi:hypothetical protein